MALIGERAPRPVTGRSKPTFPASVTAWISRFAPVPGFYPICCDRVLRRWAGHEPVTVRRHGSVMKLRLDDYVQRRIFSWALGRSELALTRRWCRHGDTMVDVGANVGVFTFVAARAVGRDGVVVSIEANPSTVHELEANLALNDYPNVDVLGVAVGDRSGEITIGMIDERQGSGAVSAAGRLDATAVPERTLDAILAGYPRARLLKIDVEGFEERVLDGAHATLGGRLAPEVVIIEVNEVALGRLASSGREVCAILRRHGYQLFRTSAFRGLVPFRPLEPATVAQGLSVVGRRGGSLPERVRRLRWNRRLLCDVVAVHRSGAGEVASAGSRADQAETGRTDGRATTIRSAATAGRRAKRRSSGLATLGRSW